MTDILTRLTQVVLATALLVGGPAGCRKTHTPGEAKAAHTPTKVDRKTNLDPSQASPPPKVKDDKPVHRGPEPARIKYPLKVKAGDKVLTYQPGDNYDNMKQQLSNRHEDKGQVVGLLPIKKGMVVADVGCGAGYFTPDLARLVGASGKVHALDVKKKLIRDLEGRIAKTPTLDPHKVIAARVSALDDVGLPPGSVDVLFLAHLDFYLHSPLPKPLARFMGSCARALRKNGKLVVLQWMQVPSQYMDRKGQTAALSGHSLMENMKAVGLEKKAEHRIRSPKSKTDITKLFFFAKRGKGSSP